MLVNIQDQREFGSHLLNRDTWSDDTVQSIVASAFVFYQNYACSDDGARYCSLYHIEADMLPHIGILDPRTGQKLLDMTGFIEPQDLILRCTCICKNETNTPRDTMM